MAPAPKSPRKSATKPARKEVKTSVSIPAADHARACFAASSRGITISDLLLRGLRAELNGVVCFDRSTPVDGAEFADSGDRDAA